MCVDKVSIACCFFLLPSAAPHVFFVQTTRSPTLCVE